MERGGGDLKRQMHVSGINGFKKRGCGFFKKESGGLSGAAARTGSCSVNSR